MQEKIQAILRESAELKRKVADTLTPDIARAAGQLRECLEGGGRVFLMGNGGSAADAQHIAAELIGRFKRERGPLPALALTVDTSALTAIGNDYGFEHVFSRQIEGLAHKGDVVIAISTSGNSENVIRGVQAAHTQGAFTLGLLGRDGGKLKDLVRLPLVVPAADTARIQEVHITIGHILCELLETDP
ncbi:MAG: SIS domain-containing protein [Nitrospinaceae bacterium]